MISVLTIWYWITSWGFLPRKVEFSSSQNSLVTYSSLSSDGTPWNSPSTLAHLLVLSMFMYCLDCHIPKHHGFHLQFKCREEGGVLVLRRHWTLNKNVAITQRDFLGGDSRQRQVFPPGSVERWQMSDSCLSTHNCNLMHCLGLFSIPYTRAYCL